MTPYEVFYNKCKEYGLSNHDMAVLLQVTPVMISRYKHRPESVGKRDKSQGNKMKNALLALRSLIQTYGKDMTTVDHRVRYQYCEDAIAAVLTQNTPLD